MDDGKSIDKRLIPFYKGHSNSLKYLLRTEEFSREESKS